MPLIGTNVNVEVEKTRSTNQLTITAITKTTEGVVSYTGTDPSVDDIVAFNTVAGMVELDKQAVRVKSVDTTADTFVMEGMDSTDFGTFVSGTADVIASWDTFGLATSLSVNEQTVDELDVTTLADTQRKIVYGLLSAVKGSIGALFESADVALANLRTRTKAKDTAVFRITFADSSKAVFNSLVAIGDSFQMDQGGVGRTTCSFTLQGRQIMFYAD